MKRIYDFSRNPLKEITVSDLKIKNIPKKLTSLILLIKEIKIKAELIFCYWSTNIERLDSLPQTFQELIKMASLTNDEIMRCI